MRVDRPLTDAENSWSWLPPFNPTKMIRVFQRCSAANPIPLEDQGDNVGDAADDCAEHPA